MHLTSRDAKPGERLIVAGFAGTYSRGFVSPSDPGIVVCTKPGTKLIFDQDVVAEVVHDSHGGFMPAARETFGRTAEYIEVDPKQFFNYKDGLRFADGRIVLVTHLLVGQQATVQVAEGAGKHFELPESLHPDFQNPHVHETTLKPRGPAFNAERVPEHA